MPFAIKSDATAGELVPLAARDLAAQTLGNFVADFARAAFEEIDRGNLVAIGKNAAVTVTVDGRLNVPLESVNPAAGVIEFEWSLVDDVLQWIWQALKDRSPVDSGDYRDSHVLLADGAPVTPGGTIPPASTFIFANAQPYARRIELGKTKSGRDFVLQVPSRIYERVAKDAKARFGNLAAIEFDFYQMADAYTLHPRAGSIRRARRGRRAGDAVPSPAIIIQLSDAQTQATGRQVISQQSAKQLQDFSNG